MINIKDFVSRLPKLDKKIIQKHLQRWRLQHCIHYNINSVNPLYLIISNADGYVEENNQNKYLGKEIVIAKLTKLWDEIKYLIETINEG